MNKKQLNRISWIYFLLGALGLVLRLGLYAAAEDDRALLVPGHPLAICLWIVTAAAVIGAAVLTRRMECTVPTGLRGAAANGVLLLGMLLTLLAGIAAVSGALGIVYAVLGGAAVGAVGYQTGKLLAKKRPFFGSYAMACLFFCIQLVVAYQGWSEHPQIQDYVFGLFSLLSGVFFAYYRGAALAELKGRNFGAPLGLLGIFFSLTAIPRGHYPWLYCAEAIWLLLEMASLVR